jgi:adenylate cyclase class 2
MTDYQEIEIKFALDNPAAMRDQLLKLGAASHGRHFENNWRLDDADHTLASKHIVLRLRQIEGRDGSSVRLTVKSPASSSDPSLSIRNEAETEVGNGAAMLKALEILGYIPYWRYEKHRETFIWNDVEAVIDELPMGWFLEIEGTPEGIRALAAKLGLDMADGITLSYARIFDEVCRMMRLDISDLTFEAFRTIEVDPQIYRAMTGKASGVRG